MKTYLINGKEYKPHDLVNWDDAIEVGGFYFSRAKYLKLPEPPACFVMNEGMETFNELTEEEQNIIGEYHTKFDNAEIDATHRFADNGYEFD